MKQSNNSVFLDSGDVSFYRNETTNAPGAVGDSETLVFYRTDNFGELTVGASRYYSALAASVRVDRLIKVWRDTGLTTAFTAVIDSESYYVRQVQHGEDDDGQLITLLSLERKVRG